MPLAPGLVEVRPAAARGLRDVRLLVPGSLSALVDSLALAARVRSESCLLALVAAVDHRPDDRELDVVRDLADELGAAWTITVGPTAGVAWQPAFSAAGPPAVHLDPDGDPPPIPEFLLDSGSPVRRRLLDGHRARLLETALNLVEERLQQEMRQLRSRTRSLERRRADLPDPNLADRRLRKAGDLARQVVDEQFASLAQQLAESRIQRLHPGTVTANKVRNRSEDLTDSDIARDREGRIVRLGVVPAVIAWARDLVVDQVSADIADDVARIDLTIATLRRDVAEKLAEAAGDAAALRPPGRIDPAVARAKVIATIHFQASYSGQMVELGWLERRMEELTCARMPLSMLLGLGSTVFAFLPAYRLLIAGAMPALFLLGLVWARRQGRTRRDELIVRELDRLRKTLEKDVNDLYEKATRYWADRASQYLQDTRTALALDLRDFQERKVAEVTSLARREADELAGRSKAVAYRIQELSGLLQQLRGARDAFREVRAAAGRVG